MITTAPRKELELDYSISEIKSAIERIAGQANFGCRIVDKNDLFNTYKVTIIRNFVTGIMNITLSNSVGKTHCLFEIINSVGGGAQPASLSNLQDYFLQLLSNSLTGNLEQSIEAVENESKTSNNNLTKVLISLIVIAIICIAGYVYNANIR